MADGVAYSFRLYIAGEAVNSARALADGIFMTPTLLRLAPLPLLKIVGTLSDAATLMLTLDLAEQGALAAAKP